VPDTASDSNHPTVPEERSHPQALAVGAVLVLAGALAATAHTTLWGVPRDGVGYASELLTVVALSFVGTFAVAAVLVPLLRRGQSPGATWRRVLAPTLVVASLVGLFGISRTPLHLEAPAGVQRSGEDSGGGALGTRLRMDWRGSAVRNGGREPGPEGTIPASPGRVVLVRFALLFVALATVMLVAIMRRAGRRGFSPGPGPSDPSTLQAEADRMRVGAHAAVVRSIDAMLADPDHRTAIIGAYARLLEELEAIGASRMSFDGPTEHLQRVLARLQVEPGALRTIVRLFEVARFSEHELVAAHRQEAVAALRSAAASLTGPGGRVAGAGRAAGPGARS